MYNYKEINDLKINGFCILKNYLDINKNDLTQVAKTIEKNLIKYENPERPKRAGYDYFGYVNLDPSFDFISKFLDPKLIMDLQQVCGQQVFLKRVPVYKSLINKGQDISFVWHTDREKPLYSLLYHFTDVNKNSPHTQLYKKIPIIDKIFGYHDPRSYKMGRLKLTLYQIFSKPISAFVNKNDVLIINNGYVLHRAFIPNVEKLKVRKNLHIAMTPNHYEPNQNERIKDFNKLNTYLEKIKDKDLILNFISKLI